MPSHYSQADISTSTNSKRPSSTTILQWFKSVEALHTILLRYGDDESVTELEERRRTLGDMLDAMGLDGNGRDKMRTSPSLHLL